MSFYKELLNRNKILTITGSFFLGLSIFLALLIPFTTTEVLGINAFIKPLKFSLSIWIYAWTMAYLLFYVNKQDKVKRYSILAVVVMTYEVGVITIQAFRGELSHFNQYELVGGILYGLMGIMIVWLTTATLILTIRFIRQKSYTISEEKVLAITLGLILFVTFSFFGGLMSAFNTHTIGGEMGGEGLTLVNWSTKHGDLRVAHFLGIHSLQVIPLFGFIIASRFEKSKAINAIWLFTICYTCLVVFQAWKAFNGLPFVGI